MCDYWHLTEFIKQANKKDENIAACDFEISLTIINFCFLLAWFGLYEE